MNDREFYNHFINHLKEGAKLVFQHVTEGRFNLVLVGVEGSFICGTITEEGIILRRPHEQLGISSEEARDKSKYIGLDAFVYCSAPCGCVNKNPQYCLDHECPHMEIRTSKYRDEKEREE